MFRWLSKRNGLIFRALHLKVARLVEPHADRISELWRYYKIGVVNTVFGFGLYTALVYFGLNLYVAQIVSHVTGAAFNYVMFRRHVFRGPRPNPVRYVASYGVNYLVGLFFLWAFHLAVRSPYVAGFLAVLATSIVNYFMLKVFVFKDRGEA